MDPPEELLAAARRWREADPDPVTRSEVGEILERADPAELSARFGGRIAFGTAGLRAPLGAGPMRLNRLVARQTAAGLSRVLLAREPTAATAGVVVAHDARTGSDTFAADIADVCAAHGIAVSSIDGPAPTPLAAFALTHLRAAAAVVVTASHNPAADNGIKVYWSDGAQIAPPLDSEIAAAIDDVAADGVVTPQGPQADVTRLGGSADDTELVGAYTAAAERLVAGRPPNPMPVAVTSLHGVGADLLDRLLTHAGHGPVHHVASQREPDPAFPTVAFPNPEEPGALDELVELARASGAAIAMANDPDADRLALAAPTADGEWRPLTGDETGAVLAQRRLELTGGTPDRLLVTTVVSSRLLGTMAAAAGVHFVETLTGFKWLSRPAMEHPGWHQLMAYEEALGYAIGPDTRDKDGITAALVAADAVCAWAGQGRSVWDVLDDLARAHGAHVTRNDSVRLTGEGAQDRLTAISERIAADPPEVLGGQRVNGLDAPAADVQRLWLDDRTRVVLRPSGTEPKFKYYCEAIEPVEHDERPDAARGRADRRLDAVVADIRGLLG